MIGPPDAARLCSARCLVIYQERGTAIERFRQTVLLRQGFACAICGTTLGEVLDVAHISRYSTDVNNRANPANGIGLCAFCHRAFDGGVFRLSENGDVSMVDGRDPDPVALAHLSSLSADARLKLLDGIDTELLRHRLQAKPLDLPSATQCLDWT